MSELTPEEALSTLENSYTHRDMKFICIMLTQRKKICLIVHCPWSVKKTLPELVSNVQAYQVAIEIEHSNKGQIRTRENSCHEGCFSV